MMNSNRHIPSDGSFVSSVDSFETATETSSAESSVLHSKKDHEMSMPQHPQSGCCIIINGYFKKIIKINSISYYIKSLTNL